MKKFLIPKKIILTLIVLFGIYLLGIPLYYTPYELQPSYWKFKEICELSLQPDDQITYYNKALGYFNLNLDTLDLNQLKTDKDGNKRIYGKDKYRISTIYATILFKEKNNYNKANIKSISLNATWHNGRLILFGNEGNMDFSLDWDIVSCGNILKRNMPDCFKDDKFICEGAR
ncbi:hypothetical protein CQA53_10585 [Helicobacter didelphidarum]|uniref:Uncharacterized protein n=1 Tax=Helicobacter didelphidarum TaxID=2040648 RepID=A0A3D8I6W2_9HELI|nr:hypothetical protein [Helicobacter didelphidarum]RDU60892.1 hypothetical protein CQA53_10585 [Helicobacter didelphidarum]